MTTAIVAPTDAQLDYLRKLCDERGLPMPAPHSKTEASLLISEMLGRRVPADRHEETDTDREREAEERRRWQDGL